MAEKNNLLRAKRESFPSSAIPGEPMSPHELAEAVNRWLWEKTRERYDLDGAAVSRWERGAVRWPREHYRTALRHVLQSATDADLGFRPAQKRSVVLDAVDYGSEIDLGVSPEEYVGRMTDTSTPTRVGMSDVIRVRKATAAIAASENMYGGGLSFASAKGQLEWATRLLKAQAKNETRRALYEAVGNLSAVVAFSAFDMGNQDLATDSFVYSLWCAQKGGSWQLRAATLADMARQAVYLDDLDTALERIEFAQVRADRVTPTGRAMLATVHARLLSQLGDHKAAVAAVDRADEHFSDRNSVDDPPWLTYYDEAEHQGSTARALTPLAILERSPEQAVERLDAAIKLHSDRYPRSRTFSMIRLATLLLDADEPSTAIPIGHQAVADAAEFHSQRMSKELEGLHKAAERCCSTPDVRDFADHLGRVLRRDDTMKS
ncbi:XRE family transcriptional regulator [Lentzea sp. JNUCC 0626]|uniref:XRE family transcriptional regulator n=1 Tax=Lentzea sp. JNUCC 0626 TaxID=3367513 RepID=UPI0037495832